MKKFIISVQFLLASFYTIAQCGSFTLSTQAEVDQFGIDYTDCTEIGNLFIEGEDITDLSILDHIIYADDIRIRNCPSLIGDISFNNLLQCRSLTINSNLNILSVIIPELTEINGGFVFQNNNVLQSLIAPKLEQAEKVVINGNRSIQSQDIDLTGLKLVNSIQIEESDNIENLSFLTSLEEVEFRFDLTYNKNLKSLDGLEALVAIYSFDVFENISLENIEALSSLTNVGLQLTFSRNYSLTSLRGLHNIEWIGKGDELGFLSLSRNNSLQSLEGLENLSEVGHLLAINQNIKLQNLDPLSNLHTVGGIVHIKSNVELTDLSGLDNVNVDNITEINLSNNWDLESCGSRFVCGYLATGKEAIIEDNKFGCRSVEQVLEDCLTSVPYEIANDSNISLHPNPTSGYLKVVGIEKSDVREIAVLDLLGRQLNKYDSNIAIDEGIDVSNLEPGGYILQVHFMGNRVDFERFVKY